MHVHVLGSAAGGGFPQWNCNCRCCAGYRSGTLKARRRTQSSIAVSQDSVNWVLFNASPDILAQLHDMPRAQPARSVRDTGIRGIVLIDAQIDHTTGLLMLRESREPLRIYCTEPVREDLTRGNPLFEVLAHYCGVDWQPLRFSGGGASFSVPGVDGLTFSAIPLKSKAPPYSPHRNAPHVGDTIGVRIEDAATGKRLFYAPGLGEVEPSVAAELQAADCVLVDGTFWSDDEMARQQISPKRARDLGHLPQSGPGGMIEQLRPLARARRILIHVNNTNPILDEDSPERAELARAGIEVAYDTQEIPAMTSLTPIYHGSPLRVVRGPAWSRSEFEKKLRAKERGYHIHHEFHVRMNSGKLDRPAIRGWVANRFCYQLAIPLKDAAFLSNCPDREARRRWLLRITDHDGTHGDEGGIEAWLRLADAVGLKREDLWSLKHALPAVRMAVDAYVNFVRRATWQEAACASLTEMFAPSIHQKRLDSWPKHYPWINAAGYDYFRKRLGEARRDVEHGLEVTLEHFRTRAEQEHALDILQFKLDVLRGMLDAMWLAYVAPPGARR